MIAPDIEVGFAVLKWTYGVVPMVDIVEALTMAHATAWETDELGLQVGDDLS